MKKILIDTNILIYCTSIDSEFKNLANNKLIELIANGYQLCITSQIIREYYSLASNFLSKEIAEFNIELFSSNMKVLYETKESFFEWKKLIKYFNVKGKQCYDCNLIAVAVINNINNILSNDIGLARYHSIIQVVNL